MWVNNLNTTPLIFRLDNFQKNQSSKSSNYRLCFRKSYQKAVCHYLKQLGMYIFEEVGSLLNLWLGLMNIGWFLIAHFLIVFFILLEFRMIALIHIFLLFELLINLNLLFFIFCLLFLLPLTLFFFLFYSSHFFLNF